jgi:hypothetical protein
MARKVVKVYLPPQQKRVLQHMCISLGMAESEALRTAFLEYAKSLGFVVDKTPIIPQNTGLIQ